MDVSSAASESFPIVIYIGRHEKMSELVIHEWGWEISAAKSSTDSRAVANFFARRDEQNDDNLVMLTVNWRQWQMFAWKNSSFGGLRELYNDWDFVITEVTIYDSSLRSYSIDFYSKDNFGYVHVRDGAIEIERMQQDMKNQSHRDFRNAEIAFSNGKPTVVWTLPTRIGPDDVTRTLAFTADLSHNLTELGIPLTLWNIPKTDVIIQDMRLRSRTI